MALPKKQAIRGARPKFDRQLVHDNLFAEMRTAKVESQAWKSEPVSEGSYNSFFGKTMVFLHLRAPSGKIKMNLTFMTRDELDTFQLYINHCIDEARPHVDAIDAAAIEAFEKGEITSERLYRNVPSFFTRERGVTRYVKGVPGSIGAIAFGNTAPSISEPGSDREGSEGLAESEPDDLGTTDDTGEDGGDSELGSL